MIKLFLRLLICFSLLLSCKKDVISNPDYYYNYLSSEDSSTIHPKSALYQSVLDEFINNGAVGTSVMIKDQHGTWLGTSGYADIISNIKTRPGNRYLIASVSKIFTATAIFSYVDNGIISLDDPINKWIDKSITDKIDNANHCKIRHLLSHTGGIPDIYNFNHLMEYINRPFNHWDDKDMLKFVYGKSTRLKVDEGWSYSNVNYILLGMILEKVSGRTLKEVYETKIFHPLNLLSAYYDINENKLNSGVVKGYTDINSNNIYVEAREFYEDDIGIGGCGGIAINAQDLGKFMNELMKGNIISRQSLDAMKNWLDFYYKPNGKAGFGLFSNMGKFGEEVGHNGGFMGFEASVAYFPEQDVLIVILINTDSILASKSYKNALNRYFQDIRKALFL